MPRPWIVAAVAATACWPATAIAQAMLPATGKESAMTQAEDAKVAVVRQMINAWDTQNWQRVEDLFTEDGVLHSMMIEPVVGRAAIGARIKGMGAGVTQIRLNVRNIGRIGDAVFVERVDEFTYKGKQGRVPVVGVIEVEGDRIKEWREYYDRAELLREMGLDKDFH